MTKIPEVTHDTLMVFFHEWARDKEVNAMINTQIKLRTDFIHAQPALTAFLAALISSCKESMDYTMVASVMWNLLNRQLESSVLQANTNFQ